jgi:hypothetical protein
LHASKKIKLKKSLNGIGDSLNILHSWISLQCTSK